MPIVNDPDQTWPYILECDQEAYKKAKEDGFPNGEPVVTVFELRAITSRRRARIRDAALTAKVRQEKGEVDEVSAAVSQGTVMRETVRLGVKGWTNLSTTKGKEVKPRYEKDGGLSDESMDYLVEYESELADAVRERNTVTLDDLKN